MTKSKMNKMIDALVDELMKRFSTSHPASHPSFNMKDIEEIDGLKCEVLLVRGYKQFRLKIESDVLWDGYVDDNVEYYSNDSLLDIGPTKAEIKKAVIKMLEILPKLKFDKLRGELVCGEIKECYAEIFKFNNIKIKEPNECVVCYDKTFVKTPCNHSLCFVCNEKLPTILTGNRFLRKCPVCRKDIVNYHTHGDMEEEESVDDDEPITISNNDAEVSVDENLGEN